jgi:hypothetical protein
MQRDSVQRSTDSPDDFGDNRSSSGAIQHVSGRRVIPVGGAHEIVVRPKIPTLYKVLLGLSLALNALVLLLLLTFGLRGYRLYQAFASELQPLIAKSAGQSQTPSIAQNPQAAARYTVQTARQSTGEALAAVQDLQAATIHATIPVDKQLPLQAQIPIQQDTTVVTNAPVQLTGPARITLAGGAGYMNGTVSMSLPPGTEMPVHLGFNIPISTTVPAQFEVPVAIPVKETELAGPFQRLGQALEPVAQLFGAGSP